VSPSDTIRLWRRDAARKFVLGVGVALAAMQRDRRRRPTRAELDAEVSRKVAADRMEPLRLHARVAQHAAVIEERRAKWRRLGVTD